MTKLLVYAVNLGIILHIVCAKLVIVTVGGSNSDSLFDPPEAVANLHDTVLFNFTQGRHTATQSTFASPCVPIQDVNASYIGFDSKFHDTANGSVVTSYQFEVLDNSTIWYFDAATCSEGGVGGVNVNDSSWQTLEGFKRNAMRLNGTATSKAPSATRTSTNNPTETTAVSPPNSALDHGASVVGGTTALALVAMAAMLL